MGQRLDAERGVVAFHGVSFVAVNCQCGGSKPWPVSTEVVRQVGSINHLHRGQ